MPGSDGSAEPTAFSAGAMGFEEPHDVDTIVLDPQVLGGHEGEEDHPVGARPPLSLFKAPDNFCELYGLKRTLLTPLYDATFFVHLTAPLCRCRVYLINGKEAGGIPLGFFRIFFAFLVLATSLIFFAFFFLHFDATSAKEKVNHRVGSFTLYRYVGLEGTGTFFIAT